MKIRGLYLVYFKLIYKSQHYIYAVFSRSNRLAYLCLVIQPIFLMILTINGKQAALKKGSSIEYVSENRIFTDADDYSMEIELPLADCPQNLDIFGMITRKDVDADDIFFDAVLRQDRLHLGIKK